VPVRKRRSRTASAKCRRRSSPRWRLGSTTREERTHANEGGEVAGPRAHCDHRGRPAGGLAASHRAYRHTGQLVEIDVHELPPLDEGDEGVPYAFKQGEKVFSDHPAVEACPGAFVPAID
jgi:hypothetical protein